KRCAEGAADNVACGSTFGPRRHAGKDRTPEIGRTDIDQESRYRPFDVDFVARRIVRTPDDMAGRVDGAQGRMSFEPGQKCRCRKRCDCCACSGVKCRSGMCHAAFLTKSLT